MLGTGGSVCRMEGTGSQGQGSWVQRCPGRGRGLAAGLGGCLWSSRLKPFPTGHKPASIPPPRPPSPPGLQCAWSEGQAQGGAELSRASSGPWAGLSASPGGWGFALSLGERHWHLWRRPLEERGAGGLGAAPPQTTPTTRDLGWASPSRSLFPLSPRLDSTHYAFWHRRAAPAGQPPLARPAEAAAASRCPATPARAPVPRDQPSPSPRGQRIRDLRSEI